MSFDTGSVGKYDGSMMCPLQRVLRKPGFMLLAFWTLCSPAETFRVATYNLCGYLNQTNGGRAAKSPAAKQKAQSLIRAIRPDVLALQEIGGTQELVELQGELQSSGISLPYSEIISGADTNIHLAVLSRFPITSRRPHTNDAFLVSGRRFRLSRGIAEVDIQVNGSYAFTLFTVHFKSKRAVSLADEADLRWEEASLLRKKLDARLAADMNANIVVLGDLNDTPDSPSTRVVIGTGKSKLVDTRPAERHLPSESGTGHESKNVVWTYHYARDDTYSRIDYLLLTRGMAREWVQKETFIPASDDWAEASDHRPLVAEFEAEDK